MIIIAAYWLFLFLLFLPAGILLKKITGIATQNPVVTLLLGMVFSTFGFTATAFFFPLGAASLAFWCGVSLVAGIAFRTEISLLIKSLIHDIATLPRHLKAIAALLAVALLLKSAQSPVITDNEGYYVQTIKWLTTYGFVPGIANVHVLLAQSSIWHVLQAGVNFSFITLRINDISGFTFLLCSLYCFTEGHRQSTPKTLHWLLFLPVFFIILIQFADAPSPDVPLFFILPVLLNEWLVQQNGFKPAFILFVFLSLIKITCLPLGLIFIGSFKDTKKIAFMLAAALPLVGIWVAKNIIISGYPLFPLPFFKARVDWALHGGIYEDIMQSTAKDGYVRSGPMPQGWPAKLGAWLMQGGLYTLINAGTLLVLATTPFTATVRKNARYRLVYAALLVNFLFILASSPQYRYFFHITIVCGLLCMAAAYNSLAPRIGMYKALSAACTLVVFAVFFNMSLGFSKSKLSKSTGHARLSHLYLPAPNTRYPNMPFKKRRMGNLIYYTPTQPTYLYGTYNGPLPCINKSVIKRNKKKFGVVPQFRGYISDGFYAAPAGNIDGN
jgi:hypothetical protein